MNGLDWTIIVLLGLGTILGFYWGVIRQVLAIVGLIAGISIAGQNYQALADLLSGLVPGAPELLNLIAFVLIVIGISMIVSAIATALRIFVGLLFLGWLDHLLGGVLGLIQSTMLIAALLAALSAFPSSLSTEQIAGSEFASLFRLPVRWSLPLLPEHFKLPNTLTFDL